MFGEDGAQKIERFCGRDRSWQFFDWRTSKDELRGRVLTAQDVAAIGRGPVWSFVTEANEGLPEYEPITGFHPGIKPEAESGGKLAVLISRAADSEN